MLISSLLYHPLSLPAPAHGEFSKPKRRNSVSSTADYRRYNSPQKRGKSTMSRAYSPHKQTIPDFCGQIVYENLRFQHIPKHTRNKMSLEGTRSHYRRICAKWKVHPPRLPNQPLRCHRTAGLSGRYQIFVYSSVYEIVIGGDLKTGLILNVYETTDCPSVYTVRTRNWLRKPLPLQSTPAPPVTCTDLRIRFVYDIRDMGREGLRSRGYPPPHFLPSST